MSSFTAHGKGEGNISHERKYTKILKHFIEYFPSKYSIHLIIYYFSSQRSCHFFFFLYFKKFLLYCVQFIVYRTGDNPIYTEKLPIFKNKLLLRFRNVTLNDEGTYKCRVTKENSPAVVAEFNLTVISKYSLFLVTVSIKLLD